MKTDRSPRKNPATLRTERPLYPFAAIVGQDEMKLGLLLNVIDPKVGGVLIMGDRGTGKSTAVRALSDLLPPVWRVRDCLYGCDPNDEENLCSDCAERTGRGEKLQRERARVPVVDLPLGSTEDRVCGSINIERALTEGIKAFEPGLLARANRGFLYIDEVNLLEDHLVDLLLDAAATGFNKVERESISVEHPSGFVLIGSGNPEEGELRPQLLDRFGLHVEIRTIENLDERLMIVERRDLFERDAASFRAAWNDEQENLRRRIVRARKNLAGVRMEREHLRRIAELCLRLKVDGHRGELTIARASRALAAFEGRRAVRSSDIERVAVMSLRHRLRRDPLDQTPGGARVEQALEELFPSEGAEELSKSLKAFEPQDSHDNGSRESSGTSSRSERHRSNREQSAPTERGAEFTEPNLKQPQANAARTRLEPSSHGRHASRARATYNTERGRYARATSKQSPNAKLALEATLRAAIGDRGRGLIEENPTLFLLLSPNPQPLTPNLYPLSGSSLRYKLYKRKQGALFIFAVDTSGSMALNRIRQAKGALVQLLERSYVRRDHVALISFRGEEAEVLLPPSRSAQRARRILDELPVGGATPLSSALSASLQLARRVSKQGERSIVLFLFTDGRANVPLRGGAIADKNLRRQLIRQELEQLGAALKSAKVSTVIVDTQRSYTSNGEGRELAHALGAHYVALQIKAGQGDFDSSFH